MNEIVESAAYLKAHFEEQGWDSIRDWLLDEGIDPDDFNQEGILAGRAALATRDPAIIIASGSWASGFMQGYALAKWRERRGEE